MATLTIAPETAPLRVDANGVVRVGNTRVLLDLVVYEFNQGSTAEEIIMAYPVLKLDEVYGAITFYLRHKIEVDAYIAERDRQAEVLRKEIEAQPGNKELREKLLARRARMNIT